MTEPLRPRPPCRERVTPGQLLGSCQECGHMIDLHPGYRAHGSSACMHCTIDLLRATLEPLGQALAGTLPDAATAVWEPPDGAFYLDRDADYLRLAADDAPVQCSRCKGLLMSWQDIRLNPPPQSGVRHALGTDCQPIPDHGR